MAHSLYNTINGTYISPLPSEYSDIATLVAQDKRFKRRAVIVNKCAILISCAAQLWNEANVGKSGSTPRTRSDEMRETTFFSPSHIFHIPKRAPHMWWSVCAPPNEWRRRRASVRHVIICALLVRWSFNEIACRLACTRRVYGAKSRTTRSCFPKMGMSVMDVAQNCNAQTARTNKHMRFERHLGELVINFDLSIKGEGGKMHMNIHSFSFRKIQDLKVCVFFLSWKLF